MIKRGLCLFLCLLLCLTWVPSTENHVSAAWTAPESWTAPKAVLYAASDFQFPNRTYQGVSYPSIYAAGAAVMRRQLRVLQKDYPLIDEALFLGDYEPSNYTSKPDGIHMIKDVLGDTWGLEEENIWFLQGNHDHYDMPGLDGAQLVYTPEYNYLDKEGKGYIVTAQRQYYSLCLIHEDAFPETFLTDSEAVRTMKRQVVRETADALTTYLTKSLSGSSRPVIILGHIPLHYARQDNLYAGYLVDALNAGAAAGRNIIYLFGHNHSGGYDNYMGGSCIYYPSGATLKIPDPFAADKGTNGFQSLRCNFTYLNAGYIGYTGTTEPGATLSSTVLEIYEDRVECIRYNDNGIIHLKNAGYANTSGNTSLPPDLTPISSPQCMSLSAMTVETIKSLKPVLAPGETDTVLLSVKNSEGDVRVQWESDDPKVASVLGQGTTAQITANHSGTAQLRARITDDSGGCCFIYMCVTVYPNEAVAFTDTPTKTVFRLVTDWSTISPEREYMLLNTDTPGQATAFAGANAQGHRVKNGKLAELVTHPQVLSVCPDTVYTAETHLFDYWQFRPWPHSHLAPQGQYLLVSQDQVYAGASNHLDPAVKGYPDATGLYMGSNQNAAGTIGWVIDTQSQKIDLACYRVGGDSAAQFQSTTGYSLYYNAQKDCFEVARSGEKVYLYERVELDLSQIRIWVEGQGNLAAGQSDTGAQIMVLNQGEVCAVPLTTEHLSGMDLSTPGSGKCTVTYLGIPVTDSFSLTVWDSGAKTPIQTVSVRDLYYRSDRLREGGEYALLSTEREGKGYALTMEPLGRGCLSTVTPAEVFVYQDTVYGAVASAGCGFVARRAKPDAGRFLLQNKALSGYLHILQSSGLTLFSDRLHANIWSGTQKGIFADGMGLSCSGPWFFPSGKGATAKLYQRDGNRRLVTYGYLTATEGTVVAKDFGAPMYPGGSMVLVRRLGDGAELSKTEIPITVTMLRGITIKDLMTPGIYHGSLWYGDTQLCSDYTLTVTDKSS